MTNMPPLPEPWTTQYDDIGKGEVACYSVFQLRAFAEEAVRLERAAFQSGIMTESQIEEAVALYNNTYCEERKGYMAGGNAERTAMRAVLDWAIRQEREAILESDP